MRPKIFCLFQLAMVVLALLVFDPERVRADEANQGIVNLVIDELKSGDPERQAGAIAIARDMPGARITQALAAELPKLSPPVQVQLLSTLADRDDPAALPAVVAAVGYADESVRVAALKAVGRLGGPSEVVLLAQRAAETRGVEQSAARECLYRLRGTETDGRVLKEISSAADDVKVELIRAVGERNITPGVEVLLATAGDEARKVRLESIRSLKVVAGPDQLQALVDLLLKLTSSSDRTEAAKTVAAVAHKIQDESRQASAVLTMLAQVENASDRASLLRVLGRIGDNSALPVLQASLDSQDGHIRDAAVRALADWPTPEPSDELLEIAQTSNSRVHKVLALRGFVRMLGQRSDLPPQRAIDLYRKAMGLAPNAVEKKRVLSGVSQEKSLAALEMAGGYLRDPALHLEAESAVVHIARSIAERHPQPCLDLLEQVVEGTANETIGRQAQELIEEIKGLDSAELSKARVETP